MQQRTAECDQELRNAWIGKLATMEAEQLVFLDESAANECSAHRKYGWAPVGITPHEYKSIKRSEHWSILPAYTADGFMSLLTGSWKQGCDPCHKNQGIIFVPVISRCTGPEQKYSDDFEIPNATFTKQTPILRDPENSRDVVLLSLLLNAKDS